MALRPAKLGVSLFRHPCRKPLPRGEGLCMLSWLCICAIVIVYCRCVLHRLCSTTCMRPCIKPLGVLSRHPCRIPKPLSPVKGCVCLVGFASLQSPLAYTPGIHAGAECGATAPRPCRGLCPCDPIFINDRDFSTDCNFVFMLLVLL